MNPQEREYPWYTTIESNSPIQQGDFFYKLPLIIPTSKIVETDTNIQQGTILKQVAGTIITNCIVMTHSCDFQEDTPDNFHILVCPISEISKNPSDGQSHFNSDKWARVANDRTPDYRILNKFETNEPGLSFFYQYVDLTKSYSIPYDVLKAHRDKQGKRVRLLPPYREYLAQAFAHRFMRVGLPIGLPKKKPYEDNEE